MKHFQKGYSAVAVLLLVIIVGLIGATGWYVYDTQNTKNSETSDAATTYLQETDSTKSFSYKYPDSWEIKPYVWENCCEGPENTEPDWSKVTQPITLSPKSDPTVQVLLNFSEFNEYVSDSEIEDFEGFKAEIKEDFFATVLFEGRRGGVDALFVRVDYLGPPDAKVESFTDHRYYYAPGSGVLSIDFREKYHHDWPDDEMGPDIDNTKYLADFELIANSISFIE